MYEDIIVIDKDDLRAQVLPHYREIRRGLERRYDESSVRVYDVTVFYKNGRRSRQLAIRHNGSFLIERNEAGRDECIGGYNFVRTIDLAVDRTKDPETVKSIWKALYTIANNPSAGTISWEMRRFIRYAPPHLVTEFGELVRELAKVNPKLQLNMDSYWWEVAGSGDANYIEDKSRKELDRLRRSIEIKRV